MEKRGEGEVEVDHYEVLGLASGEEGAKLSDKEIGRAYRAKALELHPDKRRDEVDPMRAHEEFQRLKSSYEVLKDPAARRLFDELLRVKRERQARDRQFQAKRRRMVSDLEERERGAGLGERESKALEEEERIKRQLHQEIARIKKQQQQKQPSAASPSPSPSYSSSSSFSLDKSKVLKVSWEKGGACTDYTASRLREVFEEFGEVEDVVIKTSHIHKKKGSALVVMATNQAAVAATGHLCGDSSNPLLVLPLEPPLAVPSVRPHEPHDQPLPNTVGAGYQAFESSVLDKLLKAAEKQR